MQSTNINSRSLIFPFLQIKVQLLEHRKICSGPEKNASCFFFFVVFLSLLSSSGQPSKNTIIWNVAPNPTPYMSFWRITHIAIVILVRLVYVLRAYINKSVFGKKISRIKKVVKTFLIFDKTFSKNGILLCVLKCVLKAHDNKILEILPKYKYSPYQC